MLCTAPTFRTAAIGCRMQPTLLSPCSYHTSSPSTLRPQSTESSSTTSPHRRVTYARRHVAFPKHTQTSLRSASTTSPQQAINSSPTTAHTTPDHLDWNTFFKLRRTRRFYQLGSSIGTGVGGFVSGAQVLTMSDMDSLVSQIPLDPFVTLGLITFACGGMGWLMGPILGTGIFNVRNRKYRSQMDEKEKEFYKRIKKFRVDPSAGSSMANPVPDYYGEKIASVAGYRQWLKDQRAFNKKRQTYV